MWLIRHKKTISQLQPLMKVEILLEYILHKVGLQTSQDEQTLEEKSATALHVMKTGQIVAYENARTVITNLRNQH